MRAAAAMLAGLLCLAGLTTAPPAAAATCTDGRGVSVVVDFGALGGGVQQICDADGGGKKATAIFADSGVDLTYAQRSAGFVCRVEGVPASDPCVNTSPADAYWGLWWSDGETGTWVYASLGTSSLTVPAGGSVGFAWNSGTRTPPGVTPPVAAPAAPSSPRPTPAPGNQGSGQGSATQGSGAQGGGDQGGAAGAAQPGASDAPTAGTGTPSAAASPGTDPTRTPARAPRRTDGTATDAPSATAAPGAEEPAQSTEAMEESAASTDDGGLPGWVVLAVLALVFAGAGVVAVRRRGTAGR
ncbi:hypothetical protein [Nocardioides ochotonae]|uniref:hypothetical protein n=1 Tax=Nocardioides ochotonae TaxID=2685869 RepID=UPI00140D3F51|nr:hypothetical protein [Nocardioides ochotonae]